MITAHREGRTLEIHYIYILTCTSSNLMFGLKGEAFYSFLSFWRAFGLVTGLLTTVIREGGLKGKAFYSFISFWRVLVL